jgi:phosphoserine phosphatase
LLSKDGVMKSRIDTGSKKKVFLFDLESTITREELLPRVAQLNNTSDELELMTLHEMLKGSDFESSLRERVSILANIPLADVQNCVSTVPILEKLMEWIRNNQESTFIVTGKLDIWIKTLLNKHNLKSFSSKAKIIDSSVQV